LSSINGITDIDGWTIIKPDAHNDWLNQRDNSFEKNICLYDKTNQALFNKNTAGVITGKDAWNYNCSKTYLKERTEKAIQFFNKEVQRYIDFCKNLEKKDYPIETNFVEKNLDLISWGGRSWKAPFRNGKKQQLGVDDFNINSYRPFTKQYHYSSSVFNHSFNSCKDFFPNKDCKNIIIAISGLGIAKDFSCLVSDHIPDFQ